MSSGLTGTRFSSRPVAARMPDPLRRSALDLPVDRLWIHRAADVLRRPDPDDARQSQLDVHLDHDPHRRARERDVRAAVRHLAGLGIEVERARVAVDALEVDLLPAAELAAAPLELVPSRAARRLHGTRGHPR